MSEELITIATAGEILGCSRGIVRWLMLEGRLTPFAPPHEGQRPRRLFLQRKEVERLKADGWRKREERPRRPK